MKYEARTNPVLPDRFIVKRISRERYTCVISVTVLVVAVKTVCPQIGLSFSRSRYLRRYRKCLLYCQVQMDLWYAQSSYRIVLVDSWSAPDVGS